MKVGVIGAGISGLVSVKQCKEDGLEVECFEMSKRVGMCLDLSDFC